MFALGQLLAPFRVIRAALADWWAAWATLLILNTLWILACATVILAPPATFALFYCAYELAQGRGTSISDFGRGLRLHAIRSWGWALLNLGAGVLFYANLRFYGQIRAEWGALLLLVSLLLAALWITVQLYAVAYLMALEQPRLRTALRNGLFTLLASPLYSLIFAAVVVGIGYLCANVIIGLFVGGPTLIVVLSTHAIRERLRAFHILKAAEEI